MLVEMPKDRGRIFFSSEIAISGATIEGKALLSL